MLHGAALGEIMNMEIDVIANVSLGAYREAVRTITLAYAKSVEGEIQTQKPPPPAKGAQVYKSEKQRRFVMAMIGQGKITVPYVRGRGSSLAGSQNLSQSYRVTLDGDEAVLYSAASYAPYVIGDEQAPIHQKRWLTAVQAARIVADRGELDQIVRNTLEGMSL
jgi:hypothetical protein